MVKVENPAHCPKGNVVKRPSKEQPKPGVQAFSLLDRGWLIVLSNAGVPLFSDGADQKHPEKQRKPDQVAPPDDRIAKEINSVVIAGEELALEWNEWFTLQWIFFWAFPTLKLIGHSQGLEVYSPSFGFKPAFPWNMTA